MQKSNRLVWHFPAVAQQSPVCLVLVLLGTYVALSLLHTTLAHAQAEFEAAEALLSNASEEDAVHTGLHAATDGGDTWMAVWTREGNGQAGSDVLVARSTDAGATWEDPVALNPNPDVNESSNVTPQIATNGAGVWMAVWVSTDDIGEVGDDPDVFFSRSLDNGATWSEPAAVHSNAVGDTNPDVDQNPAIAGDAEGNWVVSWASMTTNLPGDSPGADLDILSVSSTDDGGTWTDPAPLNSSGLSDSAFDDNPRLATDGVGNWLAVWRSNINTGDFNDLGSDWDIFYAFSTDGGLSWTLMNVLNSTASQDGGGLDEHLTLATDRRGGWLVVWTSNYNLSGAGPDRDVFYARSLDNGFTWEDTAVLNTHAGSDATATDQAPWVAADREGNWMAVWESTANLDGALGTDSDVLASVSFDRGGTWSAAVPANIDAALDNSSPAIQDVSPVAVTNGSGRWGAFWSMDDAVNGGSDVVLAAGSFTGTLEGAIQAGSGGKGVERAAIVLTPVAAGEGSSEEKGVGEPLRITTADANGEYAVPNLPAGSYNVDIYPVGFENQSSTVEIEAAAEAIQDASLPARTLQNGIYGRISEGEASSTIYLTGVLVQVRYQGELLDIQTYSSGTGEYELHDIPSYVPEKDGHIAVDLIFSAVGYETLEINGVTIPEDGNAEADVQMEKLQTIVPGALTGRVVSGEDGSPLNEARVALEGTAGLVTLTDVQGRYSFPSLPGGAYHARASAAGYKGTTRAEAVYQSVSLVSELDFQLEKADPPVPGDIDNNGLVNALDIQLVVNAALGIPIGDYNADVTGDGTVTAVDIQLVINYALGIL